MFEDLTGLIDKQARFCRGVLRVWATREPTVDRVQLLSEYLERDHDPVFIEHVIPRVSPEISLDDLLKLNIKTEPSILEVLATLPKERGEKVKELKTLDEVKNLLEVAGPIRFASEEGKEWCLGIMKSALHAYGKIPSRRSLEELAESLEVIFDKNPEKVIGESPKKFCARLNQSVIRGLRLIALKAKRTRSIEKDFPGFARIVEATLNPFLTGVKWHKKPKQEEKNRAFHLYLVGLSQGARYLALAGPLALNALLREKPISGITKNQFARVYKRYSDAFFNLAVDTSNFSWFDSFTPLLEGTNNWEIKASTLREILVFHCPSREFTNRAIELVSRWPKIKGVSEIVQHYKKRSLDVLEAILKVSELDREKMVKLISEAKPEHPDIFVKAILALKGTRIHLGWGLDRRRGSFDKLIDASEKISLEDGEKLGKLVSPLHPEFFVDAYLRLGEKNFERAFKAFKVVISDEEALSGAIKNVEPSDLDLLLEWFVSQNHNTRREVIQDLAGAKTNLRWNTQRILATPFGLLGEVPENIILGEPVALERKLSLPTARGKDGAEFLESLVPGLKHEARKGYGTIRDELIQKISKRRGKEDSLVEALEAIAFYGRRLPEEMKVHLIEAALDLSQASFGVSDYEIAQMSAEDLSEFLRGEGLNETERFKDRILKTAKSRFEKRLAKEIRYFEEILSRPKQEEGTEFSQPNLLAKLNIKYGSSQEYADVKLRRLEEKQKAASKETTDIDSLVVSLCQQVGKRDSLYQFKKELKKLVDYEPEEIREELRKRLFLEILKSRVDIEESKTHIVELSWRIKLGQYEMIEEVLDVGLEDADFELDVNVAIIVGAYPGIRYLSDNPLLIREALNRVTEILEEELGITTPRKPDYKLKNTSYEIRLRAIDGVLAPLVISGKKEPDSYQALTAVTDSGERLIAILGLRGGVVVGITPTASLLYSGKIPLKIDEELSNRIDELRAEIFYDL